MYKQDLPNVVSWKVSTHRFRATAALLVIRPVGPLALPGTVVSVPTTRADVHLRSRKLPETTQASAHFRDLLSCSAVQRLQTGAREALGNVFDNVAAITTQEHVIRLGSPSSHHEFVGVRPACIKHVDHVANRNLVGASIVEPTLPLDHSVVDENVADESQRDRSLFFDTTSGNCDNDLMHKSTGSTPLKHFALSKKPPAAR